MVVALGADVEILLEIERVDHVAAVGALCPEMVRHGVTFSAVAPEFWFIEDAHLV